MDEHGTLEVKISRSHVGVSTGKTKNIHILQVPCIFICIHANVYTRVLIMNISNES